MKKLILSILLAFSVLSFAFSEEENESSGFHFTSESFKFRTGGFMTVQSALGQLSKYEGLHIGGGIQGECDIELPLPYFMEAGVSSKLMFNKAFIKDDLLLSAWNMQLAPGIYARFNFLDETLFIQPGIGYGIQLNFIKKNPKYENNIKKLYLDQFIEFSLGLRYSPAALLDGSLEFGLTPFYIVCPEKKNATNYAGANISVIYKFPS